LILAPVGELRDETGTQRTSRASSGRFEAQGRRDAARVPAV